MTAVFSKKEIAGAFRSRRIMLSVWFVVLALYIGAITTMVVLNAVEIAQNRSRELYLPFLAVSIILTIIFASGSLFFFGTKFKLTHRYCEMLIDMEFGLKDRGDGRFVGIEREIKEKDGVFFYSLVLLCPPLKRNDINERKILIEKDHALPEFIPGEKIKFITHANILLAYERVDGETIQPTTKW